MPSTFPYVPTHARPRDEVIRHRLRSRLTGRRRFVVPAAVVLLGLPVAGVAAALSGGGHEPPASTLAVAVGEESRADAANRADRAERPAASAPASAASPSPSPSASTSVSSPAPAKTAAPQTPKKQEAAPAPKATTTKAAPAWVTPMPGAEITSCYGQRWGVLHAGIDLAADDGTPIYAAAAGTVLAAGWMYAGYGISVMIDHGSVQTHYAHQSRTVVQPGQKVKAGQLIGYEGSTGDSTGPHLHFEVHEGLWNQIDPAPFMRAQGVNLGC